MSDFVKYGRNLRSLVLFILPVVLVGLNSISSGCNYKFADISIPDSIKTVRINYIENRARLINPQLSPQLTNSLTQKIINQTRLASVNSDNAHYDISGFISDYSFSTSAISNQQESTNRLTVTVHIILNDQLTNKVQEYDVTRSFEFSATRTIPQAEAELNDELIKNLTDEIFNRLFSNW